jgi:hypothetical protein
MRIELQRAAAAFKSVDWVVPAYFSVGHASRIGGAIERAEGDSKQEVLRAVLPRMYSADHLAAMLLGLYSVQIYVRDFRGPIADSIEAAFSGLWHAAITTLVPVIEGVLKKMAAERPEPPPKGQKSWLILELDELIGKETSSPDCFDERVLMLAALRDSCATRLYITTEKYQGLDQLNRHGILHGIFDDYGDAINFYRLISILELLCFALSMRHGGSCFAPESTAESRELAAYYIRQQQESDKRPKLPWEAKTS